MRDPLKLLADIERKVTEARKRERYKKKRTPPTRAEVNQANSGNSTGPRTPEGKEN